MTHYDIINALFELFGSIFLTMNCVRLYKDKTIKGVSIWPTTFYSSWGAWNLYFYPMTNNMLSFYAGILVFLSNTVWVCMACYYLRKHKLLKEFQNFPAQKHIDQVDASYMLYDLYKLPWYKSLINWFKCKLQ